MYQMYAGHPGNVRPRPRVAELLLRESLKVGGLRVVAQYPSNGFGEGRLAVSTRAPQEEDFVFVGDTGEGVAGDPLHVVDHVNVASKNAIQELQPGRALRGGIPGDWAA